MGITLFVFLTGYLPIPRPDMSTRKKRRNSRIGRAGHEESKADSKSQAPENHNMEFSTTAEIIQHGIEELESAGRYSEACLDFLKCLTVENENDRLQIRHLEAATEENTGGKTTEHEKHLLEIERGSVVGHGNIGTDVGVHDRIRQHRWFVSTSGGYPDRLRQMKIDPCFCPIPRRQIATRGTPMLLTRFSARDSS